MSIKTIDVTLRDGGYRNNHTYAEDAAIALTGKVAAAGLNYVEVGYRNGPLKVTPGLGIVGLSPDNYLQAIRLAHPEAKLAVMVHPRHIQEEDIDQLAKIGISLLRLCVDMNDLPRSQMLFERAKQAGMAVSANFTRITAKPLEQVITAMQGYRDADVIYIADSNGSMTPAEVTRVTTRLRKALPTPLGFHAHNNLSLALANSIAAIEAGMTWVDASLCGMGRGAGNLATEVYGAYLERVGAAHSLNVPALFALAEEWGKAWMTTPSHPSPMETALGAYNFPGDFEPSLRAVAQQMQTHWSRVVSHMQNLETATNHAQKWVHKRA